MTFRDALRMVLPYGVVQAIRRHNRGILGSYRTWEDALQATGPYQPEMTVLIETVRKYRDREPSFLNRYDPSSRVIWYPLLAGLLTAGIRCEGRLSVLDFGGSLGQTWFGLEYALRYLPFPTTWCVVDQRECVEAGAQLFQSDQLRFYASVEAAASAQASNTVVCSSTLQYLDQPYDTLDMLARLRVPNIILDRTVISNGDTELIMRQRTPADMGGDVHPLRALKRTRLAGVLADRGYELHDDYRYRDYPMDGDAATERCMMFLRSPGQSAGDRSLAGDEESR